MAPRPHLADHKPVASCEKTCWCNKLPRVRPNFHQVHRSLLPPASSTNDALSRENRLANRLSPGVSVALPDLPSHDRQTELRPGSGAAQSPPRAWGQPEVGQNGQGGGGGGRPQRERIRGVCCLLCKRGFDRMKEGRAHLLSLPAVQFTSTGDGGELARQGTRGRVRKVFADFGRWATAHSLRWGCPWFPMVGVLVVGLADFPVHVISRAAWEDHSKPMDPGVWPSSSKGSPPRHPRGDEFRRIATLFQKGSFASLDSKSTSCVRCSS